MLKRNAILRILLIAILASVFLLIVGGRVSAADDEVTWTIKENDESTGYVDDDIGDLIGVHDKEGSIIKGRTQNIEWTITVIKTDDGSRGTASIEFTNLSSMSGTIQVPDTIKFQRWGSTSITEVALIYDIVEIKETSFEKAKAITGIKLNKNIANVSSKLFEGCTSLNKIEVHSENKTFFANDGVLFKKDGNDIILVKFPIAKNTAGYTIPSNTTKIGDYAFSKNNASNDTKITIPEKVISLGAYSFADFKGLKEIDFTNEAAIQSIGKYAFQNCTSLTYFPKLPNLTSIPARAFEGCTSLTEVALGDKVASIGEYAFFKTKISKITLPSSVKTISSYAFAYTPLNKIDAKNVTQFGDGVFADCSSLTDVVLSDNLTAISLGLFYNCAKLSNINMPINLTSIGAQAFQKSGISKIEIPQKVTSIGNKAFLECTNLTAVVVPASLTTVGTDVFYSSSVACNNNLVVYCNAGNKIIEKSPAYIIYETADNHVKLNSFEDLNGKVTQIDLLNYIYSLPVWVISEGAFEGSTKITGVTIPDTVKEIQKEAFSGCTGLKEVFLSETTEIIGDKAFYGCSGLTSVIIKKDTPINTIGDNVFGNCSSVKVYYNDSDDSVIGKYAASNSNFVKDTQAPKFDLGVTYSNDKSSAKLTISNMTDVGSGVYKYAILYVLPGESYAMPAVENWKPIEGSTISEAITKNGNFVVYIMDKVGNISDDSRDISGIDVTAPVIGTVKITGGTTGATVEVPVTDETGGSGLKHYQFLHSNDSSNVTTGWKEISGTSATIKHVITSAGTYYLHVRDLKGNNAYKEIVIEEKYIDTKAPKASVTIDSLKDEQNRVIAEKITIKLSDEGAGLAAYAIDNKSTVDTSTNWIEIKDNPSTSTIIKNIEVNQKFYIHIKDAYGNIGLNEFETMGIAGDYIAPRIEIGNKNGNMIPVTITDAWSGIASGTSIGYAWSKSNTEAPTSYKIAAFTHQNGAKEIKFSIDGSDLTGTYYLWLKISTLKDTAGNSYSKTTETSTQAYIFDNTKPTITAKISTAAVKMDGVATYTLTTSENDLTLDEKVNPYITTDKLEKNDKLGTLGKLTKVNENTWTITFTGGTLNSDVLLILPQGLFKDAAGNTLDKEYQISGLRVDNISPELPAPTLSKATVNKDGSVTYTFKVDEKLKLVDAKKSGITLTGSGISGTFSNIESTVDGKTWKITVKGGEGNGAVNLILPQGLFTDEAGNSSVKQTIKGLSFDNTAPTVSIEGPNPTIINSEGTVKYIVKSADKLVKTSAGAPKLDNFESAKVNVTDVNKDGKTWEIIVQSITGDGAAKLTIPEGTFTDEAGNKLALVTKDGLTVDNTAPKITSVGNLEVSEDKSSAKITFTTEVKEDKFVVSTNDSAEKVTEEWVTAESTTLTATIRSNGTYYIYVKDKAGNVTKHAETIKVTGVIIDNTAPTIKIEAPTPTSIKSGAKATYKIIANEEITKTEGFTATVTGTGSVGCTVELEQVSKTSYIATVTAGETDGEIRLVLPQGLFKDNSNNPSAETTKDGLVIDNTAPKTTVEYEQTENGIKVIIKADEELSELEGWTLTKTTQDNDTLVKEIADNLTEVTVKDKAGNEIKVEVNAKFATSIKLDESVTVDVGQSKELTLNVEPIDVTKETIKWTSGNNSIVTVDAKGNIKGIAKGVTTVTATSIIDSTVTATCEVTVNDKVAVEKIELDATTLDLKIGDTAVIKATVRPENASNKELIWTSSDEKVAVVNNTGNVTAIGEGTATITVTSKVDGIKATCIVTVKKVEEPIEEPAQGFKEDSGLEMKIVDDVKYLVGIEPKTTIETVLSKVAEGYTAKVEDENGEEITDNTKYASTNNTIITVSNATETIRYIVVVTGDCTGDGLVKALDLIGAVRQYKYDKSNGEKGSSLEGAKLLAIKFTDKENYAALDLIGEVRMYKEWKNK